MIDFSVFTLSLELFLRETIIDIGSKAKTIWRPVIEFGNLLKYERTKVYGDTSTFSFWYWGTGMDKNQTLQYSEEIKVTFFCNFQFGDFPFDLHECRVEYGDDALGTSAITFDSAIIAYGDSETSVGDLPIILDHLPFPFEFQLESLPAFEKVYDDNYSYTGMLLKMRRKSLGQLLSGYYYPTASFAFLSMISYLIKPDVVSYPHVWISK